MMWGSNKNSLLQNMVRHYAHAVLTTYRPIGTKFFVLIEVIYFSIMMHY